MVLYYNICYMSITYVPEEYRTFYLETGKQRVLQVLFLYPDKEFSLTDLAKEAGVAKANIGEILRDLQKKDFIKIEKLTKIWRIKANQFNERFLKLKTVYNLNLIYQSNLIEFLNFYFKNPKAIILFGSFRKAEDISNSDIDIAVEIDEKVGHKLLELKELKELEKRIKRRFQIHLFDRKSIDENLFNNIANGIVLSGFLEVRK